MASNKKPRIKKLLQLTPGTVQIIKETAEIYTNGNQSIAADQLIAIGARYYRQHVGEIVAGIAIQPLPEKK